MIGKPIGIGTRNNKLVVTEFAYKKKRRKYWICKCDCGNTHTITTSGFWRAKGCGCVPSFIIHGLSKTRMYGIWVHMIQRCYKPKFKIYKLYGARGITVCDEWRNDFLEFYKWSMMNGYASNLQLDRHPNNKGNYEPNNCRWTTSKENQRNRTNGILTAELAKEIRVLHLEGYARTHLAEAFDLKYGHIAAVVTNKIWA